MTYPPCILIHNPLIFMKNKFTDVYLEIFNTTLQFLKFSWSVVHRFFLTSYTNLLSQNDSSKLHRVFKGHVSRSNFSCNLQRSKRCVASCKKNFTCNTRFRNCNTCVASFKKNRTTLYFSQCCETSCLQVTSPLQLERVLIRHRCVASCKKNCLV